MSAPREVVIGFDGVSKRYGDEEVLSAVDLQVEAGECLALIGHNGAGKTTLMKLTLGLTRPSAGRVRVLGADPADVGSAALRRRVGYLPEKVSLYETLSGREALRFYASLKGETREACDRLLERVGLAEAADRRIATYSKGMRQRLGLAQALLGDPRLLFLDEPTTGLDPALRRRFYDLLDDLRDEGVTVLVSSHALSEIESRSDRVAILKQGHLVACGTLDQLRERAGLPVRIHVSVDPGQAGSVAEGVGGKAALQRINDRTVDLSCLSADKMEVVRRLAGLGEPVTDIEIMPPRLEEIYAYLSGEEAPR